VFILGKAFSRALIRSAEKSDYPASAIQKQSFPESVKK